MTDAFATASNLTRPRSAATIAVDNFLRKALRVSDPRDPAQVATALLVRYPEEAERDRRERAGLPYSSIPDYPAPASGGGASSIELLQAQDDLERDLQTLATSSQLKDIRVELTGWGRAVRQIASDGLAAARLALDTVNQDRALAARRQLSEYARLGRYVGALTDGSSLNFRRFAGSCDMLAGLILVAIGEGLATSGVTRSTKIVRAAAGELQSRRNAVMGALRGLNGAADIFLHHEEYPRGMTAFGLLQKRLDDGGEKDLRSLLDEATLSGAMERLIDLSTGASVDGLRELSTASALLVRSLQRLIELANSIATDEDEGLDAPSLATFAAALQLFIDAFAGKDSSRLLLIARPSIIVGGLYGIGADDGARMLLRLTSARGTIAGMVEGFAGCGCDDEAVRTQVALDYVLFLLDRAIDLYAVGSSNGEFGRAEKRAAMVGLVLGSAARLTDIAAKTTVFSFPQDLKTELASLSVDLVNAIRLAGAPWTADLKDLLVAELQSASVGEERIEQLVRSLSPAGSAGLFGLASNSIALGGSTGPTDTQSVLRTLLELVAQEEFGAKPTNGPAIHIPGMIETTLESRLPEITGALQGMEVSMERIEQRFGAPTDPKIYAFYMDAFNSKQQVTRTPAGQWLSGTGVIALRDVIKWAGTRQSFIDALDALPTPIGMKLRLTEDEIGLFFDLAPKIERLL